MTWYTGQNPTKIIDAAGNCVATCHQNKPLDTCIAIRNARLLAAAPDLLAACKALVANWPGSTADELVLNCKAVIAKAEGGAA